MSTSKNGLDAFERSLRRRRWVGLVTLPLVLAGAAGGFYYLQRWRSHQPHGEEIEANKGSLREVRPSQPRLPALFQFCLCVFERRRDTMAAHARRLARHTVHRPNPGEWLVAVFFAIPKSVALDPPRGVIALDLLLTLGLVGGVRFLVRAVIERPFRGGPAPRGVGEVLIVTYASASEVGPVMRGVGLVITISGDGRTGDTIAVTISGPGREASSGTRTLPSS